MVRPTSRCTTWLCVWSLLTAMAAGQAAPPPTATNQGATPAGNDTEKKAPSPAENPPAPAPASPAATSNLVPMTKENDLWIDQKRKIVVVDGVVCLREGTLEMFAVPKGTKEHEAIVAVHCQARLVHAALLAIGAKSGTPVRFDPSYAPPTGTTIDVFVLWKDAEGKNHQVRAQEWIKHEKSGKEMAYDFVFAGSGFAKDEISGEQVYFADGGDLICVSNFPTATLDIPILSSQDNQALLFSAFTERIPPKGTKVRLVLRPRQDASPGEKDPPPEKKP